MTPMREILPIKPYSILIFKNSGKWLQITSVLKTKVKRWGECCVHVSSSIKLNLFPVLVLVLSTLNIIQSILGTESKPYLKHYSCLSLLFFFCPNLLKTANTWALTMYKKLRLVGNKSGQVPQYMWQISKASPRQVVLKWKNCQPI